MLGAAQHDYLQQSVEALRLEVAAARSSGSAPVMLEGGERVDADALGATYRFSLLYDSTLPEGVPVQVEVSRRRWEAEVLQREGLSLLVLVRRDTQGELPPSTLPSVLLHAQPWYLLEMLASAVNEVASSTAVTVPTAVLLDLLTGGSAPVVQTVAPAARHDLNAEQTEAVGRCAVQPVWFVWGPPGTGKTTTLGHVVTEAMERRQSLLVTAHSNVAVDAALLAATNSGLDGRSAGAIVRAGPAVRPEARALGVSTREMAFERHPGLRQRWDEITRGVRSEGRQCPGGDCAAMAVCHVGGPTGGGADHARCRCGLRNPVQERGGGAHQQSSL